MRRLRVPTHVLTGLVLTLGCGGAAASAGSEHTHHHGHHGADGECHDEGHDDFSDAECFARMFDAPERDAWQRPDEVVAMLEIAPGMTVADLGAGTGYFEARLDAAVGEGGHVVALDVEASMVSYMTERFGREGLSRSEARVVPYDDPGLAAESVDRVLVVDTWHHVEGREAYAARLREALRPGGFVLFVDFTMESPEGPPPEMRITAEATVAELASAGLTATVVVEDLPNQWVVRAAR